MWDHLSPLSNLYVGGYLAFPPEKNLVDFRGWGRGFEKVLQTNAQKISFCCWGELFNFFPQKKLKNPLRRAYQGHAQEFGKTMLTMEIITSISLNFMQIIF